MKSTIVASREQQTKADGSSWWSIYSCWDQFNTIDAIKTITIASCPVIGQSWWVNDVNLFRARHHWPIRVLFAQEAAVIVEITAKLRNRLATNVQEIYVDSKLIRMSLPVVVRHRVGLCSAICWWRGGLVGSLGWLMGNAQVSDVDVQWLGRSRRLGPGALRSLRSLTCKKSMCRNESELRYRGTHSIASRVTRSVFSSKNSFATLWLIHAYIHLGLAWHFT